MRNGGERYSDHADIEFRTTTGTLCTNARAMKSEKKEQTDECNICSDVVRRQNRAHRHQQLIRRRAEREHSVFELVSNCIQRGTLYNDDAPGFASGDNACIRSPFKYSWESRIFYELAN